MVRSHNAKCLAFGVRHIRTLVSKMAELKEEDPGQLHQEDANIKGKVISLINIQRLSLVSYVAIITRSVETFCIFMLIILNATSKLLN